MLVDDLNSRAGRIASEWDGIYPVYEAFYINSIKYSVERALDAFWRYGEGLEKADSALAVSSIHEALTHAAGLSRFFWPSKLGGRNKHGLAQLKTERAAKLRKAFKLEDNSPLKDRKLRDALEHFDERLDEYLLSNLAGQVVPDPIIARIDQAGQQVTRAFKLVDPEKSAFVLLDEIFYFEPLCVELVRVSELVDYLYENGHILQHDKS